jgi:mannose-6-phosphate isomerase-like protein (cupin superfamily)
MWGTGSGRNVLLNRAEERDMPKVSKETAQFDARGPVDEWHQDVDGYAIQFVTFKQDIDATPLLKGLPGDSCHCPHWGYVLKGRVTFRFDDHEEVFEAGDAFYLPPGHVPLAEAGSEYVQFSPEKELGEVSAAMMANMAAMQGA